MREVTLVGGPLDGQKRVVTECATVVVTGHEEWKVLFHYYRQVGNTTTYEFHRTEVSRYGSREMKFIGFDEAGELK